MQRRVDRRRDLHDPGGRQVFDRASSARPEVGARLVHRPGDRVVRRQCFFDGHVLNPGHRLKIERQPVVAGGEDHRHAHAAPGEGDQLGLGD